MRSRTAVDEVEDYLVVDTDAVCVGPTTPKALANPSPGLEQPWGTRKKTLLTLKALAITPPICQRFQRWSVLLVSIPKVVASSNLGLKLANAFGVRCSAFGVRLRQNARGINASSNYWKPINP